MEAMIISRKLCIIMLILSLALAQKTLFSDKSSIILNEPLNKMDEYVKDFDKLTLMFLFDSEKEKSQNVIQKVMFPII